jgi:hypothetical protein
MENLMRRPNQVEHARCHLLGEASRVQDRTKDIAAQGCQGGIERFDESYLIKEQITDQAPPPASQSTAASSLALSSPLLRMICATGTIDDNPKAMKIKVRCHI